MKEGCKEDPLHSEGKRGACKMMHEGLQENNHVNIQCIHTVATVKHKRLVILPKVQTAGYI